MSILAAPKKKQRIGVDPQNSEWKNDTNKFGQKMLEKMGWKDGEGLGRFNQGQTANVKLTPNFSTRGLGSHESNDASWLKVNDDFSNLLADLNKKKKRKNFVREDDKSKNSLEGCCHRSRSIIYHKFIRMKDISQHNMKGKEEILGLSRKDKKKEMVNGGKTTATVTSIGDTVEFPPERSLMTSKYSMNEYFTKKSRNLRRFSTTPDSTKL
ncbi:hypothetical protein AB6A40_007681 [Gnathostoma spinigerum]|uniref:G-patch domain-containing protein n=1 Tax=Gnathostoma spinigerum TaxID=75299 RepID=A0ABD6EWC0_9BILA